MAKFIPRSVPKGEGNQTRGHYNQRGGTFRGRGRARGRGNFSADHFRGRGGRGNFRGGRAKYLPPVPPDKRGPVSILFPDDPKHPNFLRDPRNAHKIKKLHLEHDVHSDDDNDSNFDPKNDDDGNFSDEGLRITVENKSGQMMADPSFYDEIQPRQTSSTQQQEKEIPPAETKGKRKENRETESRDRSRSKSPRSKKSQKKVEKESIRITVGNDRFQSGDSKDSASQSGESPKRLGTSREEFSKERDTGTRRKPLSPGRNYDRRGRSRSGSRGRRRSVSREKFRSRSSSGGRYRRPGGQRQGRSRERYRSQSSSSRSRSRGRYHSRSPDRRGPNREYHSQSPDRRGPNREQYSSRSPNRRGPSREYHSQSPGRGSSREYGSQSPGRRDWRRDSLSSISDDSLDGSVGDSGLRTKAKNKSSEMARSKWDASPNRESPEPRGKLAAKETIRPKENPFMEFLNELDYKKLGSVEPATEKKSEASLPWLKDTNIKGSNILEIEKFLEKKLKEVRKGEMPEEKSKKKKVPTATLR